MKWTMLWPSIYVALFVGCLVAPTAAHAAYIQEQEFNGVQPYVGGNTGDAFGRSISFTSDGSRMAIGAPGEDGHRGATHIYTRTLTAWTEEAVLVASDSDIYEQFGESVSLASDGSRIAIGERGLNAHEGSVYIFSRSGSTWTHEKKLNPGPFAYHNYGSTVSMTADGSRIVVGAPGFSNGNDGFVYVYSRSGISWTQEFVTPALEYTAGTSVAIDAGGDHMVAGSWNCVFFLQGCARVYSRSGALWTLEQTLIASDSASSNLLGLSVSIAADGSRVSTSARGANSNAGAAYIFASASGDPWHQEQKITGGTPSQFGNSVSLDAAGDLVAIGEHTGVGDTFIYSRSGSLWTQDWRNTAGDGVNGDYFGTPVAITGDGTRYAGGAESQSGYAGAAYVFRYAPPQTLTIAFAGTGTGTVDSSPAGIDACTTGCSGIFGQTQEVTLTATPDSDSTFAGWTGDADCSDGAVTMNADVSCTATFTLKPQLSITFTGAGTGTVTDDLFFLSCTANCGVFYDPATVVTLTATPDAGFEFGGWTGDADCNDGIVTMNADISCTATFNLVPTPTGGTQSGSYITPEQLARLFGIGRHTPSEFGLREGDLISAYGSIGDPDVYIVNELGFKRLFLNPIIFGFYGHLGGYTAVRQVEVIARDAFPTSGLFRNCENGDEAVYGVEVTAEDAGILHHVQMTGDQAIAHDPDFFRKVFCINASEFNWYPKSLVPFTALSQLPIYKR